MTKRRNPCIVQPMPTTACYQRKRKMTKTEIQVLESMFKTGQVAAIPDGGNKYKACRKLARMFGWVERETVLSGVIVHLYRMDDTMIKEARMMIPMED